MFHANAWGIPDAAPLAGSKLMFRRSSMVGFRRATLRRSFPTAFCRSPIAGRMSSSLAANRSVQANWKTSRPRSPMLPRGRASFAGIRSGINGRCSSSKARHHSDARGAAGVPRKVAKWWLPDDVVFVDELPHTATGKLPKLREMFRDHVLPSASEVSASV